MNLIPIRCRSNLDLQGEKWPTHLPALPAVGNYIQSAQLWDNGFKLILEVYSVTWVSTGSGYIAEVELHIRKGSGMSITGFYEWYAPKVGLNVSRFI